MEFEPNQEEDLLNLDLSRYGVEEPMVDLAEEEAELPSQQCPTVDEGELRLEETPAQAPEAVPEAPQGAPAGVCAGDVWNVTKTVCTWIYRFRAVLLAIPVVVYLVRITQYGWAHLPQQVGLMMSTDGGFDFMATRDQTMWGCIALTSTCLAMMFCSKKTFYPWIVSVVSLLMPILILYVNLVLVA